MEVVERTRRRNSLMPIQWAAKFINENKTDAGSCMPNNRRNGHYKREFKGDFMFLEIYLNCAIYIPFHKIGERAICEPRKRPLSATCNGKRIHLHMTTTSDDSNTLVWWWTWTKSQVHLQNGETLLLFYLYRTIKNARTT